MRAVVLLLLAGCSSRLVREPTYGPHVLPQASWVSDLDSPPPPVEADEIRAAPSPAHLWIDGQWTYASLTRRWAWEPGAWCLPPPSAVYYAKPATERYRESVLVRWNAKQERFEELDQGEWKEARTQAYALTADGRAVQRIVRWNDAVQRFEEVDSGDDKWRWARGRFYVQAPNGATVPSADRPVCDRSNKR